MEQLNFFDKTFSGLGGGEDVEWPFYVMCSLLDPCKKWKTQKANKMKLTFQFSSLFAKNFGNNVSQIYTVVLKSSNLLECTIWVFPKILGFKEHKQTKVIKVLKFCRIIPIVSSIHRVL